MVIRSEETLDRMLRNIRQIKTGAVVAIVIFGTLDVLLLIRWLW